MTIHLHPLVKRRSPLQVAAWMTALCIATGQMHSAEAWLTDLVTRVCDRAVAGAA